MDTKIVIAGMAILLVLTACVCYGNDLDDGIPIDDEPMSKYDNVNRDININYIKLKAKSQAEVRVKTGEKGQGNVSKDQTGSINSVIAGPGSTFKGDIIIIDEGKDDKTVIVDE